MNIHPFAFILSSQSTFGQSLPSGVDAGHERSVQRGLAIAGDEAAAGQCPGCTGVISYLAARLADQQRTGGSIPRV